eukprot:snap_masked-scaffold_5-processed-gene-1.27-mRNA-1 protein AED:1.00 eAED:1.00 QI:0/0/0/0/1/1/3/0/129
MKEPSLILREKPTSTIGFAIVNPVEANLPNLSILEFQAKVRPGTENFIVYSIKLLKRLTKKIFYGQSFLVCSNHCGRIQQAHLSVTTQYCLIAHCSKKNLILIYSSNLFPYSMASSVVFQSNAVIFQSN